MSTGSTRQAWIAAGIAFLLFVAFAPVRARDGRPFQIDEALKASQTHFLRLFARGDYHSPEWFLYNIDRTDAPVGKYIFGLAIIAHGLPLPPEPSLAAQATDGHIPAAFPRSVNERYAMYLTPVRRASLVATALTAALLVWCASRLHGVAAAAAALLFFTLHDLTRGFGAFAVFDPLIALAAIAVVPPLWELWRNPTGPNRWLIAIGAGLICGLAIGVRFNGGICLAFAVIALLVTYVRHRSRSTIVAIVLVVVTASVVFIALNPYYWAAAPSVSALPTELRANEALPIRIVNRIRYQMRDLSEIIASLNWSLAPMPTIGRRAHFFSISVFSDVLGFVLLLSVALGILLPLFKRDVNDDLRFFWIWAVVVAGGTALWLPVAWQRYLIVTLPPLALVGGVGVSYVIRQMTRVRSSSCSTDPRNAATSRRIASRNVSAE